MKRVAKIGINGFGRIGKQLVRLASKMDDIEVVGMAVRAYAFRSLPCGIRDILCRFCQVDTDLMCSCQCNVIHQDRLGPLEFIIVDDLPHGAHSNHTVIHLNKRAPVRTADGDERNNLIL